MTGAEFAEIRRALCGTDTATFGRALGMSGNDATVSASVRRLEIKAEIPKWFAKLAAIYAKSPKYWNEAQA